MNKPQTTFDKIAQALQAGTLVPSSVELLRIEGEAGERKGSFLLAETLGGMSYHEAIQDGWLVRALAHCGLEAEILFQDDIEEGGGERLHRVVGQRGPDGWAVEVDYYVDTEERYVGTCHGEVVEGQAGVENKLLQIRHQVMAAAAEEMARIMQKSGALFSNGFGELREVLMANHPEVARDAFRAWDAIGLGERLEADTPNTGVSSRIGPRL